MRTSEYRFPKRSESDKPQHNVQSHASFQNWVVFCTLVTCLFGCLFVYLFLWGFTGLVLFVLLLDFLDQTQLNSNKNSRNKYIHTPFKYLRMPVTLQEQKEFKCQPTCAHTL